MTIKVQDLKEGQYYETTVGSPRLIFILESRPSKKTASKYVLTYSMADSSNQWGTAFKQIYSLPKEMDLISVVPAFLHPKDSSLKPKGAPKGFTIKAKLSKAATPAKSKFPARAAIEENKTATHCVKCKQPTKEIALFNSMTRYCPACE